MDTSHAVEQQIQAEIEQLRDQFPQTQDLYREACVLLFFRFGITPTANKLYQFVRKGSMSAPAQALTKFWGDLREKSRIRIEHPDLPEELRAAAGELTAALWTRALAGANETFVAQRSEMQAAVLEAQAAQADANQKLELVRQDLAVAQQSNLQAADQIRALEQHLASEVAGREATEAQLRQVVDETHRLQIANEQARREFATELEKQRSATLLTEERFYAAEERALLEIDRERTQAAKLQKELEQARSAAAHQTDRHRAELASLQTDIGQLRQRIGILEGALQTTTAARDQVVAEAGSLRGQLTEALSQSAARRVEADHLRQRAEELQVAHSELQARVTRRHRKADQGAAAGPAGAVTASSEKARRG